MVVWNQHEHEIIAHYAPIFKEYGIDGVLKGIPEDERKYKCYNCFKIFRHEDLVDGKCPICGSSGELQRGDLKQLCPLEHNGCSHTVTEKLEYCPVCNQPICPACGDHNVVQISRVTGYLADVSGFNNGKRAELIDRHRYNPLDVLAEIT